MAGIGRADYWAPGDWNAVCYECGRKRKASMLKRHWQGYYVCPQHNEPRQPQDFVRGVPDNQMPPWIQPPGDSFDFDELLVSVSDGITTTDVWFIVDNISNIPILTGE